MSLNTRGTIAATGSGFIPNLTSRRPLRETEKIELDAVGSLFGERLRSDVVGMTDGKPRAGRYAWWIADIARGRKINPLGLYPMAAAAEIDMGRGFHSVARPLYTVIAYLKQRAGVGTKPLNIALREEQKAQGEEDNAELLLAECVNKPERAVLEAFVKEGREHEAALQVAVESAEALLLAAR